MADPPNEIVTPRPPHSAGLPGLRKAAVRVVAVGPGWQVVTEGEAMNPGLEGQTVRIRTESGRLLQGRPVGDRQVEVAL